jgi:hypothetical protein
VRRAQGPVDRRPHPARPAGRLRLQRREHLGGQLVPVPALVARQSQQVGPRLVDTAPDPAGHHAGRAFEHHGRVGPGRPDPRVDLGDALQVRLTRLHRLPDPSVGGAVPEV